MRHGRLSSLAILPFFVFLISPPIRASTGQDESPVCPGRPYYVQPTLADSLDTGLSQEALCVIADTPLARDLPSGQESTVLLKRYLRQGPYSTLSDEEYVSLMQESVRIWPNSRFAHEGLARALLARDPEQKNPAILRHAADELLKAAHIALESGLIRYEISLGDLLSTLADKPNLDQFFSTALSTTTKSSDRYRLLLSYAKALGKLGDERADSTFRQAILLRPLGVGESLEFYGDYLISQGKMTSASDLAKQLDQAYSEPYLRGLGCRIRQRLGEVDDSVDCYRGFEIGPDSTGSRRIDRAKAGDPGLTMKAHTGTDDCRHNEACTNHPNGPQSICFYQFTWNLAELITNEAGGEAYGSKAAVGWTIRDRVLRQRTVNCKGFPGALGDCTSECPSEGSCAIQRSYCCVIHSGAFVDSHVPSVSFETLKLADGIIDGFVTEPLSAYVPEGATGCTSGVCDNRLLCSSDFFSGSPVGYPLQGPIFFYANYASKYVCKGFQPGISSTCNVVAQETCGNSKDGVGSDNCFGRATRNRTWLAGSNFSTPPNSGVTTDGQTKRLPPGSSIYLVPSETIRFNTGGKEFVVEARLDSKGNSRIRVLLKDASGSVVQDFGPQNISSTKFANKTFTSTGIVSQSTERVEIKNEGAQPVIIQTVTGRD